MIIDIEDKCLAQYLMDCEVWTFAKKVRKVTDHPPKLWEIYLFDLLPSFLLKVRSRVVNYLKLISTKNLFFFIYF